MRPVSFQPGRCKKRVGRLALVARFYGIDPRTLTPFELRAWEENIGVLRAQELLRERGGSLDPDELFRTMWLATGDRAAADKARSRRMLDLSRRR